MQDAAGGNASTRLMHALLERGGYLESLTREELVKILPILEAAHDEMLGRITKTRGAWTKEWLEDEAAELDELYKAAAAKAYNAVKGDLEKLASDEGAWIAAETHGVAIGLSLSSPAPSLLRALVNLPTSIGGSTLEQLFEALAINSREAVYTAISQGMIEGDTVGAMTRRLRGSVVKRAVWRKDAQGKRRYYPGQYEGGAIEGVSTRQAETLARTAVMHVANSARDAFYAENADLIKGYQRVETLDLNTCIVCGADDGHVYKPDEPRPALPIHPDCRGLWAPVLKSWRELGIDEDELPEGTRASMDGQVAESVTYADRLAKMTPAERVKALGPGRAAMYEKGVKLGDMVKGGRAVPIKELQGARAGTKAMAVGGQKPIEYTVGDRPGIEIKWKDADIPGGHQVVIERDGTVFMEAKETYKGRESFLGTRLFRDMQNAFSPLAEDEYVRLANNKADYEYAKAGTLRVSVNHATNEEEGGVSVAKFPEFPAKYAYFLRGERVGIGTDGEPLVAPQSIKVIGKQMSYADAVKQIAERQAEVAKKYGFADVRTLNMYMANAYLKRGW